MPKENKKSYSQRNRPPLERVCTIFHKLKNNQLPNCTSLSEEFGCDEKTIRRDIDFMRDRQGLPIDYDASKHGYYFTKPVAHFPLIHISEGELVSVFIAQKALSQYHGTPFEQPLKKAFN